MSTFSQEEKTNAIIRTLMIGARDYVKPISWCTDLADAQSIIHIASCFALRIGDTLFGVTAAHVIDQYLTDQQEKKEIYLCIRDQMIELELIENGNQVARAIDIATFQLSEEILQNLNWKFLAYTLDGWPPPPPTDQNGLILAGYPKDRQEITGRKSIDFVQVANRLTVERVSERNIAIEVRAKYLQSSIGTAKPDLTTEMGGYSGAPLLLEAKHPGRLFEFGGIFYEGLLRDDEEDDQFVDLRAEPARRIRPDGHFNASII